MTEMGGAQPRFWVGIDGGGTGTRAVIAAAGDPALTVLGRGTSGPSGLSGGIEPAWRAIAAACEQAFAAHGAALDWQQCAVVCALAGVNHAGWRAAFMAAAPAVARLAVESDAYAALIGAHAGLPGVIVALGTGSVGAVLRRDGSLGMVGGYGFPSSDEASGAWLGMRALVHAQRALDGRAVPDDFAAALLAGTGAVDRPALVEWLAAANQARYAALAPVVLAHRQHPFAQRLLRRAAHEVTLMIEALDPAGDLPVALCGSLGEPVSFYLEGAARTRLVRPHADAACGALRLAARLML